MKHMIGKQKGHLCRLMPMERALPSRDFNAP